RRCRTSIVRRLCCGCFRTSATYRSRRRSESARGWHGGGSTRRGPGCGHCWSGSRANPAPREGRRVAGSREFDEAAWVEFDAALREIALPGPDPSLRERCMPGAEPRPEPLPVRRILVVDDEPNIRRLIEVTLRRAGYLVST